MLVLNVGPVGFWNSLETLRDMMESLPAAVMIQDTRLSPKQIGKAKRSLKQLAPGYQVWGHSRRKRSKGEGERSRGRYWVGTMTIAHGDIKPERHPGKTLKEEGKEGRGSTEGRVQTIRIGTGGTQGGIPGQCLPAHCAASEDATGTAGVPDGDDREPQGAGGLDGDSRGFQRSTGWHARGLLKANLGDRPGAETMGERTRAAGTRGKHADLGANTNRAEGETGPHLHVGERNAVIYD